MARFLDGDDEAAQQRRCRKLKMIPSIPEGSWFIKNLVGQTPVILGTKLKASFHRGPGYIESTIDVSTNATAANVTNIVSGAARSIVLDLAILLEGQTPDELPEALLGIIRLKNLDWNIAYPLDISKPISNDIRVEWLK